MRSLILVLISIIMISSYFIHDSFLPGVISAGIFLIIALVIFFIDEKRLFYKFFGAKMNDPELKTFTVYWRYNKKDVLQGATISDALNKAGFGNGAMPAIDFYAEGNDDSYEWNSQTREWDSKGSSVAVS